MHPFFQQNPFRADAASDIENNARLALHLVLFLLSTQDPDDGTWNDAHIGAKLRNTCHALEALYLLGWEDSIEAVESGIAWLVDLPDIFDFTVREEDSVKLYPSRFKTLAWLGEFTDPQLRTDFEELGERLDEDGLLRGIMAKQLLATIVYVDCLDHLKKSRLLPSPSYKKWARALDCIEQNVSQWYQDRQQNTRHSHITPTDIGDLSYAVDLLFRTERLSGQDELSHEVLTELISELERSRNAHPMDSDTLYCAIQLTTHFSQVAEAKEAVQILLRHLRARYERQDLRQEPLFFHSLVLRVMLTYYGDQLKAEMTRLMLEHERQNLELRRQSAEQRLKGDFSILIKNRFDVEITGVRSLAGGITDAEIFRVDFFLKLALVDKGQETEITSPRSLVIKSGSLDSLLRSIARYQNLSDLLKPYFAKHAGEPQILETDSGTSGYLVMEDLTNMNTFRDIMINLDRGRLSRTQKEKLGRACDTICRGLFTVYNQTKQGDTNFFGSQLSRLYISPIEKSLINMCRVDKFPHLKSWLNGFWLGHRKYRSIEYYLRKLESHKAKLKIPYLMLVHGDCHSRNIMVDDQLRQLRLIDLDYLDEDGDYIKDFALLIEDIAIFGFLLDDGYRFHLHKGQVHFPSKSGEPNVIETRIEYSPFSSEAVRLFQRHMLKNLEVHAETINDDTWKERLWLAMATTLIYLVSKQAGKKYATVIYVEAIKLLDDLVSYLDKGVSLGNIPFPEKHPIGVKPGSSRDGATVPSWHKKDSIFAGVHKKIMSLDPVIKCELDLSGRVAQYFAANPQQPFAVVNSKKQPVAVLLACAPNALSDPLNLAQKRKTESFLQTVLHVSEEKETAVVIKLLQQAFELNR